MAGLVSPSQVEVALQDQSRFPDKKLGEILALRGWIKPETVEFFVHLWPKLLDQPKSYPLGYYLTASGLLTEAQLQDLLKEQQKIGIRIGALAVLRGWLKQETVDFFLKKINPVALSESAFANQYVPLAVSGGTLQKSSKHRSSRHLICKKPTTSVMKSSRRVVEDTAKPNLYKPLHKTNPASFKPISLDEDDLVLDENDLEIDIDWIN